MRKPLYRQDFISKSNGTTKYTASAWSDGTMSCNCPGWANLRKGKPRGCTHTKELSPSTAAALDTVNKILNTQDRPTRGRAVIVLDEEVV